MLPPRFRAAGINAYREIEINPHPELKLQRPLPHRGELTVSVPLEIIVILHALDMVACERRNLGRAGIAILERPRAPAPRRPVARIERIRQRVEKRGAPERIAARVLESTERVLPFSPLPQMAFTEVRIEGRQHLRFQPRDTAIVDPFALAQRAHLLLKR